MSPVPTVALKGTKNGQKVKLGRKPPRKDRRTLALHSYLDFADLKSPPPSSIDLSTKAMASISRMYLNDTLGDCVIAAKWHIMGVVTGNDNTQGDQTPLVGPDSEVDAAYVTICGPGDEGCVITDVLDYWKQTGLKVNGQVHKIDGYVSVDWTNKLAVQVALFLFGNITIGINLPDAWTCTNCVWDITNTGIVGGHDVCCVGYDETGVWIASWAGKVKILWAAFTSKKWIEEAYIVLSPDWYGKDNLASNGVNVTLLQSDLAAFGGGSIPDPGPTPTPVPPGPTPIPPTPVPPTPAPTSFAINIPKQPVAGGFFTGYYVPPITVNGTLSDKSPAADLPDWVTAIINQLCTSAPTFPEPYGSLASFLCFYLRTQAVHRDGLPPWIITALTLLCNQAANLPAPWSQLATLVCGLVTRPAAKAPCGCH